MSVASFSRPTDHIVTACPLAGPHPVLDMSFIKEWTCKGL